MALQENRNDLEFEHILALKLSMTVGELRARMSQLEFLRWSVYFARRAQAQEIEAAQKAG